MQREGIKDRDKKNNLKVYFLLVKYGINLKICMAFMVLFALLGIAIEGLIVFADSSGQLLQGPDFGALLLLCAAMYPGQILMSVNFSTMVQGSAYKRKLHTMAPVVLCTAGNFAAVAVILLIRGLGAWVAPDRASEIMGSLAGVGILVLAIDLLAAFVYKFFLISIMIYIAVCLFLGTSYSYCKMITDTVSRFLPKWNSTAGVIFCLAMVFLGGMIQYLLSVAVYRHPFSKAAFGSNTAKKFV